MSLNGPTIVCSKCLAGADHAQLFFWRCFWYCQACFPGPAWVLEDRLRRLRVATELSGQPAVPDPAVGVYESGAPYSQDLCAHDAIDEDV